MSSAKRNSSSTSVSTLDLAYNLLRLKSFPSKRYLIGLPLSTSWKASVSMAENIMLNSVEASIQPCLTPFCHRESIRKLAIIIAPCKHTIMELPYHCYEFGRTNKLCHDFPKSLTTNCVKCFGKVDKGLVEVHILFLAFFLKIMSIVPLSFLNPHPLSGRSTDCSRSLFNRFTRTLARIFPATEKKRCLDGCHRLEDSFEWVDNCCILEFFRNGFFSPHNVK